MGVTLAPELPAVAPADAIPVQPGPGATVSLTGGCETPMEALKAAKAGLPVGCHPCDEAIVRLLLARLRRCPDDLVVSQTVRPGTLALG